MNDTLTGCPDRQLEPKERKDQNKINYMHDSQEAETEIGAFLEEYKKLFPDEIRNFLIALRIRVSDEMEERI